MYSINGVKLHDQTRGWSVMRAGTNTQGGVTKNVNKVPNPGRPGYVPAPSQYTEQVIIFQVRCPKNKLEELLALCAAAYVLTLDSDATKMANVELVSALPSSDSPFDLMQDVTVTLNAYDGVWRDVSSTVAGPTTISTPSQIITGLIPGSSAPVFDADIFVRGVFGQFTLSDQPDQGVGSFLKTTRAWPGSGSTGLLFFGSTQQAFFANESDPFTPVSDASRYVDVSGNGGFRITPKFASGDPHSRSGSVKLITLTQTSTTLRVRAKGAYRMN